MLLRTKRPEAEVMRVGGDEFAVLAWCDEAEGRALALHLELVLAHYRAADERLYAT